MKVDINNFRISRIARTLQAVISVITLAAFAVLGTAQVAEAKNPVFSLTCKDNLQDSWTAPDLSELPKEEIHFKQNYKWNQNYEISGVGASKVAMVTGMDGGTGNLTQICKFNTTVDMANHKHTSLINSTTPLILTLKGVAFDDNKNDIDMKITFSNIDFYGGNGLTTSTYVTPALFSIGDRTVTTLGNMLRTATTKDGKTIYFTSKLDSSVKTDYKVNDTDTAGVDVGEYPRGFANNVTDFSYKVDLIYSKTKINVSNDKTLFATFLDYDIDGESITIPKNSLKNSDFKKSMFFYPANLSWDQKIIDQQFFTADAAKNKERNEKITAQDIARDRTVLADTNVVKDVLGAESIDGTGNNLYILGTSGIGNSPTFNAKHYSAAGHTCNIATGASFYDIDGNKITNALYHDEPYVYHNDYHYYGHNKEVSASDALTSGWTMLFKPHTGTFNTQQRWSSGSTILQQVPPRTITAKVLAGQGEIIDTDAAGDSYKADGSKNTTSTIVYWKHDQTFTVKPAQYYRIKSIKSGNGDKITGTSATNNISVANPLGEVNYTFSSVTANKQIVAEFEKIPAQLNITKNANSFEYAPGDLVTYTIEVTDTTANSAAYNVKVTDNVPSDLEVQNVKASGVDGANVSKTGNTITATAPLLPYGTKMTITITAKAKSSGTGKKLTNIANATCENPGATNPVLASDIIWINDSRIKVNKAADKYEYHVGDRAHFTIGLHDSLNKEGTIAKNVVLTDIQSPDKFKIDMNSIKVTGIPDSVDYPVDNGATLKTETRKTSYSVAPAANGAGFTITIPYLPGTANVSITYDAIATRDIIGLDAINTVKVTTDNPNDPGDDTETRVWVNNAEVRISKNTEDFEHRVGDVVDYTLVVSNVMPDTIANNVVVRDTSMPEGAVLLPGSISVIGVSDPVKYTVASSKTDAHSQTFENRANTPSCKFADGSDCPISIGKVADEFDRDAGITGGNGFILSIPYLPSSDTVVIKYSVRFDEATNGNVVTNKASISCDNPIPNQPPDELESEEEVYLNSPDIVVTKTTTTPSVKVSGKAHYKIVVKNQAKGTIAGNPVEISDAIPHELELIPDSITVSGVESMIFYPITKEQAQEFVTDKTNNEELSDGDIREAADSSLGTSFVQCKTNSHEIKINDNNDGFSVFVNYIAGNDSEIVIEYDVNVLKEADGKLVKNIVTVSDPCEPDSKTDDEILYVPTTKKGYQTTLYKSANPKSGTLVKIGQEIEYTLTLRNTGNDVAQYTHIRDYIPDGTTFASVSDGGMFVPNLNQVIDSEDQKFLRVGEDADNGYVEWVVKDLQPNTEIELHYVVIVGTKIASEQDELHQNMTSAQDVENNSADDIDSNVSASENRTDNVTKEDKQREESIDLPLYIRNIARYETADESPGNPGEIAKEIIPSNESNEVIHSTDENHPAPAIIDVEKLSTPAPGSIVYNQDNIAYSLIVRNNGGSPAKNTFVRDYIIDKIIVNQSSITMGGVYDENKHAINWLIENIDVDSEVILSFTARVTDTAPNDIISNQALFEMDWDVASDSIRDPKNSSNIVEHLSDGDYAVADDLVALYDTLAETGFVFPFVSLLLIITCLSLALWYRRTLNKSYEHERKNNKIERSSQVIAKSNEFAKFNNSSFK